MASFKTETEILNCSICLEMLQEPKILPCFHPFCKECLSQLIQSNSKREGNFRCPTCRQVIDIPDEGVEGFKGDFLIQEILEIRRIESKSKLQTKNRREQTCSSCDTKSNMVAFCSECECLICNVCFFCHKTMKAMQGHIYLVPIEGIDSHNIYVGYHNDTATYCPIHADVILEKYCLTCKEIVCASCDPSNTHQYHHVTKISKSERLVNIVQRLEDYFSSTKQNLGQQLTDVYGRQVRCFHAGKKLF